MEKVVRISLSSEDLKPVRPEEVENGRMWGRWRYKKETMVLELVDETHDPSGWLEFDLDYVLDDPAMGMRNLLRLMAAEEVSRQDLTDIAIALFSVWCPRPPYALLEGLSSMRRS